MTVNRTTLLDLPLPVTGTESGTWGDTTNNGLTQYLDIAIAGTLVLSTDADVTLTSTEGDSSATNIGATTAQYAILRWTATGSTTRNITALAQSKTYVVINATGGTQSIVLRGAGPTTGVTIISGEKAHCVWNGSDFVKVSSSAAAGGSNTQVQYNSSGVLAGVSGATTNGTAITFSTTNLKLQGSSTGVSSFASANSSATDYTVTFPAASTTIPVATQTLTFSGPTAARTITLPDANFTAARTDAAQTFTGVQTFSSNPVLSGGTANGVLYLNGSKVATSGSALTFDGTTATVNSGTNNTGLVVSASSSTSSQVNIGVGVLTAARPFVGTNTSTNALEIGTRAAADTVFVVNSTEQMRLTSTGLGIGTSSPATRLQIGDATVSASNKITLGKTTATTESNLPTVYAGSLIASGVSVDLVLEASSTSGGIAIRTAGSTRAVLDSSGNLGLGVTPSAWSSTLVKAFQIADNGCSISSYTTGNTSNKFLNLNNNAYYDAVGWKYIASSVATARYELSNGEHRWYNAPSGTAGNAITFTQAMTLDSSGNLGIGTSSPAGKLQVTGSTASWILNSAGTELYNTNSGQVKIYASNASGSLFFGAGGRDSDLRLDSSGNLGLGVTPSATQALYRSMELFGSIWMGGNGTTPATYSMTNNYYDGSFKYKTTGYAATYYAQQSGQHQWHTAASGTAGNAITFTQAMTLSASAELNIDSGTGGGRLTFTPAGANNTINSTTTGFGAYSTIRTRAADHQWLIGASTQAMTLDASGNLIVGGNSASASSATTLYNDGTIVSILGSGVGGTSLFGAISGVSNGYEIVVTSGNAQTYKWFNGGTQAMTLDASGNLGVGTTSPQATIVAAGSNATVYKAMILRNGSGTDGSSATIDFETSSGTQGGEAAMAGRIAGLRIGSGTSGALTFSTTNGGTLGERARIDSSGNLLVGKTTLSGTTVGFQFKSTGEMNSGMAASTNSDSTLSVYSTGASAYRFYVGLGGTVYATSTTISAISDIRFKENVRDLDAGLAEVMALKPRLYDWKEGKGANIKNARGFIAQEFEQVFPDLIDEWKDPAPEGEDPYKSVRQDLIPVLVKAIQEQQALITSLTARVALLEGN